MNPQDRIQYRIAALKAAGQWREPVVGDGGAPPVGVDARSNDYLGLAANRVSRETVGGRVGAGASRLVSGTWTEHRELERELATWLGVEAALVFSSGYAANVGALSALAGPGETILSDALNHASIIDGCRLSRADVVVLPHADLGALERALSDTKGVRWVVTESYFGMDGDSPDLRGIRALCDEHQAALVVDEAHALGVFGPEGRGLCAQCGVIPDVLVGGMGKALGVQGGFVACNGIYRDWLWNRARSLVFSTGLSPALAALALIQVRRARRADGERQHLRELERRLAALLSGAGVAMPRGRHGPLFPVIVGSEPAVLEAADLAAQVGVRCQPIRPPTVPRGSSRLRVSLRADMSESDVDRIGDALVRVWESRKTGESAPGTGAGPVQASANLQGSADPHRGREQGLTVQEARAASAGAGGQDAGVVRRPSVGDADSGSTGWAGGGARGDEREQRPMVQHAGAASAGAGARDRGALQRPRGGDAHPDPAGWAGGVARGDEADAVAQGDGGSFGGDLSATPGATSRSDGGGERDAGFFTGGAGGPGAAVRGPGTVAESRPALGAGGGHSGCEVAELRGHGGARVASALVLRSEDACERANRRKEAAEPTGSGPREGGSEWVGRERSGAEPAGAKAARDPATATSEADEDGGWPGRDPDGGRRAASVPAPTSRRWIILGTGTGVGKTFVAGGLVDTLREAGYSVAGLKPIETGLNAGVPSDASRLAERSFHVKLPARHPLYGFPDPITPSRAARAHGQRIELSQIAAWLGQVTATSSAAPDLVIETAGGVFSPLGDDESNFDLACSLHPATWVLVASNRLGVLHDVASTLRAMAAAGRAPDWLVLSAPEHPDASTASNRDELARIHRMPPIIELPRADPGPLTALLGGANRLPC